MNLLKNNTIVPIKNIFRNPEIQVEENSRFFVKDVIGKATIDFSFCSAEFYK
tara:strand:+ start:676 stop:831 length:156 start_codon:yes stop_codon:yes gene_type:complete